MAQRHIKPTTAELFTGWGSFRDLLEDNFTDLYTTLSDLGVNTESILLDKNTTTGISLAGTYTTGLSVASATTGISLTGAYTTGIAAGTSSAKLSLSATANRLLNLYSTSALAAGNVSTATLSQTLTGASSTNTAEVLQTTLTSNVQVGNWANALSAKIDFSTVGYVTGIAGVVCAELDMPAGVVTGSKGTYTCFEAELNMPTNFSGGGVPVSFMNLNLWGAQSAQFDTSGFILQINGVADHASGKVFQANTAAAATHALRIKINNEAYYIMLTDQSA